jgi:hypothetical protein
MELIHLQAKDYTVPWANQEFKSRFGPVEGRKCYEIMHNRKSPCKRCPTFQAFEDNQPVITKWSDPTGQKFMTIVEPLANDVPLLIEYAVDYESELSMAK